MAASPQHHNNDVPLAVWPVAQTSSQQQRTGRYVAASTAHPGKMVPALARRVVETYSTAGQLVLDPMCGIGTTLVEGAELGRRCLGVELEDAGRTSPVPTSITPWRQNVGGWPMSGWATPGGCPSSLPTSPAPST